MGGVPFDIVAPPLPVAGEIPEPLLVAGLGAAGARPGDGWDGLPPAGSALVAARDC